MPRQIPVWVQTSSHSSRGDTQRHAIAVRSLVSHLVTHDRIVAAWDEWCDRVLQRLPAEVVQRVGDPEFFRLHPTEADTVGQALLSEFPIFVRSLASFGSKTFRLGQPAVELLANVMGVYTLLAFLGTPDFAFSVQVESPQIRIVPPSVRVGDRRSLEEAKRAFDDTIDALADDHPLRADETAEIRRDVTWWYRRHVNGESIYQLAKEYRADHPELTQDDQRQIVKHGLKKAEGLLLNATR
jgi:hypothetical protein